MSLLLDALKKAASEKEKLKSTTDNKPIQKISSDGKRTVPEIEEELSLDLDINEEEKYPKIDKKIKNRKPQVKPIINKKSNKEIKKEYKENVNIEKLDDSEKTSNPEKEPIENRIFALPKLGVINKIENKEALSELINKSNQSSRRSKSQFKIIIATAVTMVFLVTGIYLYFEYYSASQNIYIESAPINEIKKIPENIAEKKSSKSNADKKTTLISTKLSAEKIIPIKNNINKIVKGKSFPVKKNTINIIHDLKVDPVEGLVHKAYIAFNQQDYKESEVLYKKAIVKEADNRDALLGLAAIAIKQQRYEYARQKYLQLRHLNSKDSLAIAGLSLIQSKINSKLNESEIKFMLREQPDSAPLYFSLGSIYARQKKWAGAQASFFSAWSAENTNGDYAFNLAVSLDQLGKKPQAKKLYQLSLKLNKSNKWNFSNKIVEKRIKVLNEIRH